MRGPSHRSIEGGGPAVLPRAWRGFRVRITVLAHLENGRRSKGHSLRRRIPVQNSLNKVERKLGLSRSALRPFIRKFIAYPEAWVPARRKIFCHAQVARDAHDLHRTVSCLSSELRP